MKKTLLIALSMICLLSVFPQEKKMSIGAGLEWNMDSRQNFAGGIALGFDYQLPANAAIGVNLMGSINFRSMGVIEPIIFIRGYLPQKVDRGFFAQFDTGAFLIIEDKNVIPMPLVGVRTGYRFLLGKSFFVEPYGRLGYPFAFGVGAMGGFRF